MITQIESKTVVTMNVTCTSEQVAYIQTFRILNASIVEYLCSLMLVGAAVTVCLFTIVAC